MNNKFKHKIKMKKVIVSLFLIGAMLSSCSDRTQVEATDAENVELVETAETIEYTIVKDGSKLDWRATHLGGISERYGIISLNNASFLVNNGELTNAKVEVDMNSFTVDNFGEGGEEDAKDLKDHLLSADFFDVENNPTTTFELTGTEKIVDGLYNSRLTGNLTIMEITKSITFNANVTVSEDAVSMKSEKFILDRTDWELKYHVEGSEGVPVDYIISDDLEFTIDVTIEK